MAFGDSDSEYGGGFGDPGAGGSEFGGQYGGGFGDFGGFGGFSDPTGPSAFDAIGLGNFGNFGEFGNYGGPSSLDAGWGAPGTFSGTPEFGPFEYLGAPTPPDLNPFGAPSDPTGPPAPEALGLGNPPSLPEPFGTPWSPPPEPIAPWGPPVPSMIRNVLKVANYIPGPHQVATRPAAMALGAYNLARDPQNIQNRIGPGVLDTATMGLFGLGLRGAQAFNNFARDTLGWTGGPNPERFSGPDTGATPTQGDSQVPSTMALDPQVMRDLEMRRAGNRNNPFNQPINYQV